MSKRKVIALAGGALKNWGPWLKESGLDYQSVENGAELQADFCLIDAKDPQFNSMISMLKKKSEMPIISLIDAKSTAHEIKTLRELGVHGYMQSEIPNEEALVRIQAMLKDSLGSKSKELRSAKRIWFQQEVTFKIFDRTYQAWSTTLSETGIFLRTPLSFPLYSLAQLKFQLFGEEGRFECEGVLVRQETEGEVRGVGIMFQNLKGDAVRRLESFLDLYRS